MINIKEKALKEVVQQLALYKFSNRETKSAEERAYIIVHKLLAEVDKANDDFTRILKDEMNNMDNSWKDMMKIIDKLTKEYKQRLGIR